MPVVQNSNNPNPNCSSAGCRSKQLIVSTFCNFFLRERESNNINLNKRMKNLLCGLIRCLLIWMFSWEVSWNCLTVKHYISDLINDGYDDKEQDTFWFCCLFLNKLYVGFLLQQIYYLLSSLSGPQFVVSGKTRNRNWRGARKKKKSILTTIF